MESNNNISSNLLSLNDKVGSSLDNEISLELDNNIGARLNKKLRLALYDKAIRVIENWEMTGNTNVTYVKSPNPIDLLVNIAKNATNLLISNKKDQPKNKKKRQKKETMPITEKGMDIQNPFFIIIQHNTGDKDEWSFG